MVTKSCLQILFSFSLFLCLWAHACLHVLMCLHTKDNGWYQELTWWLFRFIQWGGRGVSLSNQDVTDMAHPARQFALGIPSPPFKAELQMDQQAHLAPMCVLGMQTLVLMPACNYINYWAIICHLSLLLQIIWNALSSWFFILFIFIFSWYTDISYLLPQ